MNIKITGLLVGIALISLILTAVNFRIASPPCFNADEAAFSYNAYSILKTGRDEYGAFLPLRLKSFGDYKMPLFSYLSVPFIALFGLNEFGARSLNLALSILFPIIVFYLTQELFLSKKISIVAALLSALSLGLHIVARHAHEAYLAALLTTLSFLVLVRFLKKQTIIRGALLGLSILLMLFSYHPGRLFAGLFFVAAIIYLIQVGKVKSKFPALAIILTVVALFSITDIMYKPERLKSLLFFSNPSTQLKVQELKTEGGFKYVYHPLIIGLRDIAFEHLTYFSPQFLVQNGDSNDRFGYKGMGLITPVEYVFFFIGIYYVYKNKERWRHVLLFILFFSPLSASLSWATSSMTRSLFLLIPVSIFAGYGLMHAYRSITSARFKYILMCIVLFTFGFFLTLQWDFYLFHYPKRLTTIHAWQCGYKEIGDYVQKNYKRFDQLYITREIGMPYIFMLFYLNYPPEQYQKQAHLSAPDEYGFGQIEGFDKFKFEYKNPEKVPYKTAIIGSRDDVKDVQKSYPVQMVSPQGEPMFGIIEK